MNTQLISTATTTASHPPRIWLGTPNARVLRTVQIVLTLLGSTGSVAMFAQAIEIWSPASLLAAGLVAVSAVWISGGAATALIGLLLKAPGAEPVPVHWVLKSKTAILFTLCGEDALPLAAHIESFRADLRRQRLGDLTQIFVLSDTGDPEGISLEESALHSLIASGSITYRRRKLNVGRKPGNIAAWHASHGRRFDYMVVLDADSRMSARRIRALIRKMDLEPSLGLLQAGIALVPGKTRFGALQRLSSRLLSPNFLTGFAATVGATANYWGHNALLRVAAFPAALDLPRLPGKAPMGGEILSHDFIEAAWMRRAGWHVRVDPTLRGSAEDAPQTLRDFIRRDRRWCQGNLQHIQLLSEPGLHPLTRVHLMFGILSYLAAPVWLALLLMLTSGLVTLNNAWPLLPVIVLLFVPKLCGLFRGLARARTWKRRLIFVRAFAGELLLSTVLAPIIMVRQVGSVIDVLRGRDCGWKGGAKTKRSWPVGMPEMLVALALTAIAAAGPTDAALWLLPVIGPLLSAPLIIRYLDQPT
ncbi:MAG: glucans biosynthesis glucosyltransferase MdoH [Pseudomonadota bacterium]